MQTPVGRANRRACRPHIVEGWVKIVGLTRVSLHFPKRLYVCLVYEGLLLHCIVWPPHVTVPLFTCPSSTFWITEATSIIGDGNQ